MKTFFIFWSVLILAQGRPSYAEDYFKFQKSLPLTNQYFSPEGGVCSPISVNNKVIFYDEVKKILYIYNNFGHIIEKIDLVNLLGDGDFSTQIASDQSENIYLGKNINETNTIYKIEYPSLKITESPIESFSTGRIRGLSVSNKDNRLLVQIIDDDNITHVLQLNNNLVKTAEIEIGSNYGHSLLASSTSGSFILTKKTDSTTNIQAFDFNGNSHNITSNIENFISASYDYNNAGKLYIYSREYSIFNRDTINKKYEFLEKKEFNLSAYDLSGVKLSEKILSHDSYFPRTKLCTTNFSFYDNSHKRILVGDSQVGKIFFLSVQDHNNISLTEQWPNNDNLEYVTDIHIDNNIALVADFIKGVYSFNGLLEKKAPRGMSLTGGNGIYYITGPFEGPTAYTSDFERPLNLRYIQNPAIPSIPGSPVIPYTPLLDRPYVVDFEDGILYTAEIAGKIYSYDSFFGYKKSYDLGLTGFDFIQDLEVKGDNVYIVTANDIYLFSLETENKKLVYHDNYHDLKGITFDEKGNFYISVVKKENGPTPLKKSGIKVFNSDFSNEINFIGSYGDLPSQVKYPRGIQFHDGKLYVADSGNNRVVVYEKLDRPSHSKAIIIAAENDRKNSLWDEVQSNAHHAFLALTNQGYTKENILYLNHNTQTDLDGNGAYDEIDDIPTKENIRAAITQWAADSEGEDVVLYMIGHGGLGKFTLGKESLTAVELNDWLNELQSIMPGKVTIIYDACNSGSFNRTLSSSIHDRTIIASAQADQLAYFQDAISFSRLFWSQIFNGTPLLEAFESVKLKIDGSANNQTPQLESTGDGISNKDDDYNQIVQDVIGSGSVYASSAPIIDSVGHTPVSEGGISSTITAYNVSDDEHVHRVWGIVRQAPGSIHQGQVAIQDLPTFDFIRQADGNYQATYEGFQKAGTYEIAVYAVDREGNTSLPSLEIINVTSPLDDKAILISGVDEKGEVRLAFKSQTDHAYRALLKQGFNDNKIDYHWAGNSADGGIDLGTSRKGLISSLTDRSSGGVFNLLVYLVGDIVNNQYQLSASESVSLTELSDWLQQAQDTISGTLTIMHEGANSGELIAQLGKYPERIVISSSAIGQSNYIASQGDISFSQYFWNKIATGANIGDAFTVSEARIRHHQSPQINSNGNAFTNEKLDRYEARRYQIGLGIVQASSEPVLGRIADNSTLHGDTSSLLWVDNIVSTNDLLKVWAMIEPPEYNSRNNQTGNLIEVPLQNNGQGRWQAEVNNFQHAGVYTIQYYAKDNNGEISAPLTSYITQSMGADAYEPDDTFGTATELSTTTNNKQWHNFDKISDIDFIRFYADPSQGQYTIKVSSNGSTADTKFSLFSADETPVALGVAGSVNEYIIDTLPADSTELAYWLPKTAGYYLIKVQPAEVPYEAGISNGYTVSIFPTNADQEAVMVGFILDKDRNPIKEALIQSKTTGDRPPYRTDESGEYYLKLRAGTHSMIIDADGFIDKTVQITVKAEDEIDKEFILERLQEESKPTLSDSNSETPIIQTAKLPSTFIAADHLGPVIMQILQINIPAGGAELHSFTLQSNEATKVKTVKIYHDTNQNQLVDSTDRQIGSSSIFTTDNGNIDLSLTTPYTFSQGQQYLMVSYELH